MAKKTDWTKLSTEIDSIIDGAAKRTDDKLAGKISSLTHLKDSEIQSMFPAPTDVKKFVELMEIVKSADAKNNKINQIIQNGEKFGGIILTLLDKVV